MAMSLTSFIDTPVTIQEHPINRFIRDAIQLQTFGEPKDILKLYVGVAGIQYCGVSFEKLFVALNQLNQLQFFFFCV